jgi:hypothetical protein
LTPPKHGPSSTGESTMKFTIRFNGRRKILEFGEASQTKLEGVIKGKALETYQNEDLRFFLKKGDKIYYDQK